MWLLSQRVNVFGWSAILFIAGGLLVMATCFAADTDTVIKEFQKPSAFNAQEMNINNLEKHLYEATGVVDAVNDKAISIGDIQYTLEPGVRINCRVGSYVGIKLNDQGNVVACEPVRRDHK